MRVEGKRLVVTGATRGIGAALARQLVGAGATVLAVARDADRLQAMAAELGPCLIPMPCDLAEEAARVALIADLGAVDGLINNAALQIESDYAQAGHDPAGDIRREAAVNFTAPLHLSAALLPGQSPCLSRGGGLPEVRLWDRGELNSVLVCRDIPGPAVKQRRVGAKFWWFQCAISMVI